MDINKLLDDLRETVRFVEQGDDEAGKALAREIAELDAYLSAGGFLPREWDKDRKPNA